MNTTLIIGNYKRVNEVLKNVNFEALKLYDIIYDENGVPVCKLITENIIHGINEIYLDYTFEEIKEF